MRIIPPLGVVFNRCKEADQIKGYAFVVRFGEVLPNKTINPLSLYKAVREAKADIPNHMSYWYGKPVGSGTWYEVAHKSIITKELFDKVQERLAIIPKSRPGTKEFDFTKLIYCGVCESGVTAEEKFKRQDNGVIRRYVYYHCTGGKDRNCKQPYIREEEVTEQICNIMDQIDPDTLNTQKHLQEEITRYERFMQKILKQKASKDLNNEVDLRDYSKFVLREGDREEKRELLNCLKIKMSLKDKKITVIK